MKHTPPNATKKEHFTNYHKEKKLDPYFWLKEKENPEVLKHLKNENAFFLSKVKPCKKIAAKVFSELKNRIPKEDESVPVKRGESEFFSRRSRFMGCSLLH